MAVLGRTTPGPNTTKPALRSPTLPDTVDNTDIPHQSDDDGEQAKCYLGKRGAPREKAPKTRSRVITLLIIFLARKRLQLGPHNGKWALTASRLKGLAVVCKAAVDHSLWCVTAM